MATGQWFDGLSAQDRPVRLTIEADHLAILDPADGARRAWPIAGIVRCDPDAPGPAITLRYRRDPARLVVADPSLLDGLRAAGARIAGTRRWTGRHWGGVLVGLVASVALLALLVDRLPSILLPLVPRALERSWSAASERALAGASRRCAAPAGQAALSTLMATLSHAAGIEAVPRVKVLDDPDINAFTLPDGRVLVLRGLISHVADADELAGVLAHELGHARHRDPTREMLRHVALSMVSRSLGWSSGLGSAMTALSYGRRAEARADASAIATLQRAGLRTDGLGRFLGSLAAAPGGAELAFLSDHPSNQARIAALPTARGGRSALAGSGWQDVKARCGP